MKEIYVMLLILIFSGCTSEARLDKYDENVFIAGKALSELPCNGGDSFDYGKKTVAMEGIDSYSIFYYYDSTGNSSLECPMKVTTRIRVSPNVEIATSDYDKTLSSALFGINVTARTVSDDQFYSYGDRSSFSYIQENDDYVGFYFISQKGVIT